MRFHMLSIILLSGALMSLGCGSAEKLPDIGKVEGTVTLDGEPLANARVTFLPKEGPASGAMTDAEGKYTLIHKTGVEGASFGAHKVEISTDIDGTRDPANESVPKKYNDETTLTAEVEAGTNTIDFELLSK